MAAEFQGTNRRNDRMPKAVRYTKGSVIYFEGDEDDRIFILQNGVITLATTDIETGSASTEYVKQGEFLGIKSAFGHFPREETAMAASDSLVIIMTIAEFEQIFTTNKQLIMKMLRVFSNQLRAIHRKIESILKSSAHVDQSTGMLEVAKSFYADKQYKSCCDICFKLLKHFPKANNKDVVAKLYSDAKIRVEKTANRPQQPSKPAVMNAKEASDSAVLKAFSLPSFERFAKEFEKDSVIIAEYEPGATFYLIQAGHVQLVKCVNNAKKNLDILHAGEIFGEMAILENTPRSATCVALDTVKALEFNRSNFELLVTGNPQLALMLLRMFCKRIFDQRRRFRVLCIHDLPTRIADVILLFDEMNHSPGTAERSRRFNLTVQDIAHWAGVSVEIAREEMGKFSKRRKIDMYESYIVVNNIADLRRTVDQNLQIRHVTTRT